MTYIAGRGGAWFVFVWGMRASRAARLDEGYFTSHRLEGDGWRADFVSLPHPGSGAWWEDAGNRERAIKFMRRLLP